MTSLIASIWTRKQCSTTFSTHAPTQVGSHNFLFSRLYPSKFPELWSRLRRASARASRFCRCEVPRGDGRFQAACELPVVTLCVMVLQHDSCCRSSTRSWRCSVSTSAGEESSPIASRSSRRCCRDCRRSPKVCLLHFASTFNAVVISVVLNTYRVQCCRFHHKPNDG